MALSESMFLFELVLDELQYGGDLNQYYLKGNFADIFSVTLQHRRKSARYSKRKGKAKVKSRTSFSTPNRESVFPLSGSVLFACNLCTLMWHMKTTPIDVSLWSKTDTGHKKIGSTKIPWKFAYLEFLHLITTGNEAPPVKLSGEYLLEDNTSNCTAKIKVECKLCVVDNKIPKMINPLSETNLYRNFLGYHAAPIGISCTFTQKLRDGKKEEPLNYIFPASKHETKVSEIKEETQSQTASIANNTKSAPTGTGTHTPWTERQSPDIRDHPESYEFNLKQFSLYERPQKEQVYCVGYCLLENKESTSDNESKPDKESKSSKTETKESKSSKTETKETTSSSTSSNDPDSTFNFCQNEDCERRKAILSAIKSCAKECPVKKRLTVTISEGMLPKPEDTGRLLKVTSCKELTCKAKHRAPPPIQEKKLLLDFTNYRKICCQKEEVEVRGEVKAKMQIDGKPCECTCECRLSFMKKTAYCTVCGGYERPGEDFGANTAHPCPIFHKLVDLKKLNSSHSGSGSKASQKSSGKKISAKTGPADKKGVKTEKSIDSEAESKKSKKKKKDDRFKFNYGYQAPQIGHEFCGSPCTGTRDPVPKKMGWLWTADDIPGMKPHTPEWRPGCIHKHNLQLFKQALKPGYVPKKKRKKDTNKKKKNEKRPLLIVHKKAGEFDITMETMKTYTKPRTNNQYPYEDLPLVTYTVGRTAEENLIRKKKKEREHRRTERAQRVFLQSAFKDVCREICLKAYQQALGLLPNTEDPTCMCFPAEPDFKLMGIAQSCSCSEYSESIGSTTDSDEWYVEFTPPSATYDPQFKPTKSQKADGETQYSYLDYKVKLMDRFGNPVPRFFKGPDGKTECSDLGGFWGPNHEWLDINVDGFIGPDGRWAPMTFIGPDGDTVDAETGKFQVMNGCWLTVGVDGFVDSTNRWRYYSRSRRPPDGKKPKVTHLSKPKNKSDGDTRRRGMKATSPSWSCFGDVSPRTLSERGIVGHAHDKALLQRTLRALIAAGEPLRLPEPPTVPRSRRHRRRSTPDRAPLPEDRLKCHHATPSQKGIIYDDRGHKKYFRITQSQPKRRQRTTHQVIDSVMYPITPVADVK